MSAPNLVALVMEVRPMKKMHVNKHMGRATNKMGLDLLKLYAPSLAETTHNNDQQKPFTASSFLDESGRLFFGEAERDTTLWLRFTGLSDSHASALLHVYERFHQRILRQEDVLIEIDYHPWQVMAVHVDDHPWAGTSTYEQLMHGVHPRKKIQMDFVTPTTFSSMGANMPLPIPKLVFGSLLTRWMDFTKQALPKETIMEFINYYVLLNEHDIETHILNVKDGGTEIGFTGYATFALSKSNKQTKKFAPDLARTLRQEYDWYARMIHLLADFAFYSGVGRKTTTGMGGVRLMK
jgi:CRISPR-associated endoribonuclease Cas6